MSTFWWWLTTLKILPGLPHQDSQDYCPSPVQSLHRALQVPGPFTQWSGQELWEQGNEGTVSSGWSWEDPHHPLPPNGKWPVQALQSNVAWNARYIGACPEIGLSYMAPLVHVYNSARHDTTGFSPYYLLFGREPRMPIDLILPSPETTPKTVVRLLHLEARKIGTTRRFEVRLLCQDTKCCFGGWVYRERIS